MWGYSSAGRAPALHAGGLRFDSVYLHHFGWICNLDCVRCHFVWESHSKLCSSHPKHHLPCQITNPRQNRVGDGFAVWAALEVILSGSRVVSYAPPIQNHLFLAKIQIPAKIELGSDLQSDCIRWHFVWESRSRLRFTPSKIASALPKSKSLLETG